MSLQLVVILIGLFPAQAHADGADARPRYCVEPDFVIRGEPEKHSNPRDEEVLTAEEAADPARARLLAATPGPYGHSVLGFRYLARLFGYQGTFGGREEVEKWILKQEAEHPEKRGMWKLWERWAIHPPKRLAVPRGPVSALPANGDPDMFFLDPFDRIEHARCLKVDVASRLCESYQGGRRPIQPSDVVQFARSPAAAEKYGYCHVVIPPWRQAMEAQRAKEAVTGAQLEPALGVAHGPNVFGGAPSAR